MYEEQKIGRYNFKEKPEETRSLRRPKHRWQDDDDDDDKMNLKPIGLEVMWFITGTNSLIMSLAQNTALLC
jgi:hypothetical protein